MRRDLRNHERTRKKRVGKAWGPQGNQWKWGKMVQNKAGVVGCHQIRQIRGGSHQVVREPGTSRREKKDARVEKKCNAGSSL